MGDIKFGVYFNILLPERNIAVHFLYGVIKESRHIIVDNAAEVLRSLSIRWRFDLSCDLREAVKNVLAEFVR